MSSSGVLDTVSVSCGTKSGTISDSIDVNISESGPDAGRLAPFEVLLNGKRLSSKNSMSLTDAMVECKKWHKNSSAYSAGDVLECYWNGQVIERVDEWKG